MKAVVVGAGAPRIETLADPEAALGGCVVRVTAALLRAEERAVAANAATARVPGSAFVGVVEAVDPGAGDRAREWIGSRVAVHPVVRCGRCDRCVSGLGGHCASRVVLGVDRSGGLAERVAVPIANLVALADGLDDERAAFAVPVSEAIELTRHVRVDGKAYVTVVGSGLSALIAAQVLGRLNAAVRIVAADEGIAATAERLGLRHRLAGEVGRRGDQHVVVDCEGTAASFELSCQLARPRGTILLRASREATTLGAVVNSELRVQGVGLGTLPEALDLIGARGIETATVVDRRLALSEAPAAIHPTAGRLALMVRP